MRIGRIVRLTWKDYKRHKVIIKITGKDNKQKPVSYFGTVLNSTDKTGYFVEPFWFNRKYWDIEILEDSEAFLEVI